MLYTVQGKAINQNAGGACVYLRFTVRMCLGLDGVYGELSACLYISLHLPRWFSGDIISRLFFFPFLEWSREEFIV